MMSYRERLVGSYEEVVESTKAFNAGLIEDLRLQERLSDFKVWYYIREIDAVGPSKFIGYREMNADFYLAHAGKSDKRSLPKSKGLDSGATERRLKKWFRVTEPGTPEEKCVSDMVKALLGQWEKKPKKGSRYNVPST